MDLEALLAARPSRRPELDAWYTHVEIVAIRAAFRALGTCSLAGREIVSSCVP